MTPTPSHTPSQVTVITSYSIHYTKLYDDGTDTVTSTLTIGITPVNDPPTIVTDSSNPGGANDVVYESGLTGGSGTVPATITVEGTFTLGDPDGLDDIQSVTIGGTTIDVADLGSNNTITGSNGTLTVTGYNASTGVANRITSYNVCYTKLLRDRTVFLCLYHLGLPG